MLRWLAAVAAVGLVIAALYLFFLNPDPVVLRLTPHRSTTWPLAVALLAAFLAGGTVVGVAAGVRAGARGWRSWRADRRARRQARRSAAVARAQHLVWAGDYGQARSELLRGEDEVPADRDRLVLLAETHLHEGDPAAARGLLEDGLHRIGLDPRLLDLLAEAAERGGDHRAAVDALERARKSHPESPRLARRLRDAYAASGRWADALALQGEIVLRVRDATTLSHESRVMRGLRYETAIAEADERRAARLLLGLAREDPGFLPAWVSAGDVLARAGRRLRARRVWERAARRQPAVVLLDRLERLNASDGKPDRTSRLLRRLQRRHPESEAIALVLARHLLGRGLLDDAGAVLEALPDGLAAQPLALVLAAELARRRGNATVAADGFARAAGPDLGMVVPFRCSVCRREADAWRAYCEGCHRWGTYGAHAEWTASPD
jgi:predicted Zn-dependent protease